MNQKVQFSEAELRFLYKQRVARLATVTPEGNPHLVPVCYAFDGHYIYTPLDEKPKRVSPIHLQRVRNILAHPTVAFLLDHYEENWAHLGYLMIRGQAQLITPNEEVHPHALRLLRMRYIQYRTMALEEQPVIMLIPERVTSWGPVLQ